VNPATEIGADILLVEDDPNDAELISRALRRGGVAATMARVSDGVEALDYLFCRGAFAARPRVPLPKLMLLDLKLPKLTGLEVLRAIRADAGLKRLVVVMLTSSKEERDLAEAYDSGINSYVVKPVNFEQLMDSLARMTQYWLAINQLPADAA
jgi:two-component system response regulator